MVPTNGAKSCGFIKAEEEDGKCSFVLTLDNDGHIEISPHKLTEEQSRKKQQQQQQQQQQERICSGVCSKNMKSDVIKTESTNSKRRFSIAILKEEATTASEEREDVEKAGEYDVVSIEAMQTAGALPRFVKIYNKSLSSKPSFVVLEDALVRKRIEENLQPCHCHAQQQTSPCDIGAHTGSQTDEYLLQYALSPQLVKRTTPIGKARVLNVQTQSRLPVQQQQQQRQQQIFDKSNHQTGASVALTGTDNTSSNMSPHVTISFLPTTNTKSMVNPSPSHCSCACGNHCCLLKPVPVAAAAAAAPIAPLPTTCDCHHGTAATPIQHQTVGYSPHPLPMVGNYSHLTLPATVSQHLQLQQQQQLYPLNNWHPHSHHCLYYPISTMNTAASCPNSHCLSCRMHGNHSSSHGHCGQCFNQQQQLQLHHQQQHQHPHNCPAFGRSKRIKITDNARREKIKRLLNQETITKPKQPLSRQLLQSSVSSITVKRANRPQSKDSSTTSSGGNRSYKSNVTSGPASLSVGKETEARSIAAATVGEEQPKFNWSSLYMSRFGRTCLVLKPTTPSVLPRLLTKRISRYTSVMAWPSGSKPVQKSAEKPEAEKIPKIN